MDFDFTKNTQVEADKFESVVPEQFRGAYAQNEDGAYVISPTAKGLVEAVSGLNKSLKASRQEAKDYRSKAVDLGPLSEFGETVEDIKANIQTKIDELQQSLAKGDDAKLNLDKVKADLQKAFDSQLGKKDEKLQGMQASLEKYLISSAASEALAKHKGVPDLLMPHVHSQTKVVRDASGEYRAVVVDKEGDARISTTTGQEMTVSELVAEMKSSEVYGRAFESEAPRGGGTPPGGGGGRKPTGEMSATQKIAAGLSKR